MACTSLNDVKLKPIDLASSHAAQARQSKDNFTEIEKYINNNRCRIKALEDGTATTTVTTTQIKTAIRTSMLLVAELKTTHVDGNTVTQTNGVSVTRSGNNFIIQTPDNSANLLHALRVASTKKYATGYEMELNASNHITIKFAPFIKENLELIIFG